MGQIIVLHFDTFFGVVIYQLRSCYIRHVPSSSVLMAYYYLISLLSFPQVMHKVNDPRYR